MVGIACHEQYCQSWDYCVEKKTEQQPVLTLLNFWWMIDDTWWWYGIISFDGKKMSLFVFLNFILAINFTHKWASSGSL
jgi:hypothetical protein